MKSQFVSLVLAASLVSSVSAQTRGGRAVAPGRTGSNVSGLAALLREVRDLRDLPPVADRAAVRFLEKETAQGNAVVFVQFARSSKAPTIITLQLEQGRATLRDDGIEPDEKAGDGVHSGFVWVDPKELAAGQEQLLRAQEAMPIFAGRQIVAEAKPEPVDGAKLAGLSDIPVFPSRANFADAQSFRDVPTLSLPIVTDIRPGVLIPIFPLFPLVNPADVNPQASLIITNTNVVNDPVRTFNPCTNTGTPMGKWTFGHLMKEMANTPATGITAEAFTRRWLKRWEVSPLINDIPVPARPAIVSQVVNIWPKLADGVTLDLSKAPFKLVAIVYRGDLAQNLVYGGGSAGEARFVFALTTASCTPRRFLVIFEYGIKRPSCMARKAWGQAWFDLKNNPIGSPAYNAALEALTVQFTEANTNPSQLPNKSSLNQLRTNEFVISPFWELREFHLAGDDSDIGHLRETTVKRTPDFPLDNQQVVADFINANAADILNDTYDVDAEFPVGTPFLGATAPVPTPFVFWDGPAPHPNASIATPGTRHKFSLNTCNGCHGGETATTFTHISENGVLSAFLTGETIPDAAGEPTMHTFNDIARRQQALAQLLSQPCLFNIFFQPLNMAH